MNKLRPSVNEIVPPVNNVVKKLIDDKRRHLERKLSAAQRDALLLEDAKEEKHFRRELSDA